MILSANHVEQLRDQFPALARQVNGQPAVFLDGPAGTQVPLQVVEAISSYLLNHNANHDGVFVTSVESDRVLSEAHQAAADLLGADDAGCVAFGANMTTLTFALSRALARTWTAGDEVLVTRLEHDANFTPWRLAAEDAGATVRYVDIDPDTCTLDLEDFARLIGPRTRLVAVGCASNAVGTVNPVKQICQWARDAGALSFLDAVHFAPHDLMDVCGWQCDFLVCSAYKFFGPHVGLFYGRRELLETLQPYKLRPATDELPGRWMTGTQNHECLAGVRAAIDYLAEVGRTATADAHLPRRAALTAAFTAIRSYERGLLDQLLDGLADIPAVKVWGITEPAQRDQRFPTVSITHRRLAPAQLAVRLAGRGIFTWHGNYYALPLTERLGLEPEGMVRMGLVHYNTPSEVDRVLSELSRL